LEGVQDRNLHRLKEARCYQEADKSGKWDRGRPDKNSSKKTARFRKRSVKVRGKGFLNGDEFGEDSLKCVGGSKSYSQFLTAEKMGRGSELTEKKGRAGVKPGKLG